MIRKTITFILYLALYLSVSAQAIEKSGRVEFGIKGGMNLSTASTHYKSNEDIVGYNVGANLTYYMDDKYTVNTGLEYITKGVTGRMYNLAYLLPAVGESTVIPEGRTKTEIEMSFLQLPIVIGYELVQTKHFVLDVRAGTYIAYGLKVKVKENFKGQIVNDDSSIAEIDFSTKNTDWDWQNLRRFDWGAIFGLGMKFDKVFFNCTYDIGLLNMGNARINDGKYKYRLKNRSLSLSLGYSFIAK